MKKIREMFRHRWLLMVMAGLVSLGAVSIAGCAGSTKTSTVTTTTEGVSGGGTTSVTTETQETSAHPRGVIGGIFYTIGQVLIWPFKLIGSLF